jgi:peptidoglycan L-alanyl-D-glutamate endopeptidase CwlK
MRGSRPGNKLLDRVLVLFVTLFLCACTDSSNTSEKRELGQGPPGDPADSLPEGLGKLLRAYPTFLDHVEGNHLIWMDGTRMPYDDRISDKSFDQMLESPDLQDQMSLPYSRGEHYTTPVKNQDPGRVRYEPFFRKMYGTSASEVYRNLVPIAWLPKTVRCSLLVTSVNGIHERLEAVSKELDDQPHLSVYLDNPAGTYNWRKIQGTKRLSAHSFGIAIDINVEFGDYWRWDADGEQDSLAHRNRIPIEIVEVFEKQGFIWGGKWYHYDTMHFEYRPELLVE